MAPVLPLVALERQFGIYREACAKSGHAPSIICPRPIYLGADEGQIRRECEPSLLNFIAYGGKAAELLRHSKAELEQAGYGFYASDALESLRKLSYDDLVRQEIAFVGSPAAIIDKIAGLQEKAGITEFDILVNYGGLAHWQALKQQELFAQQVMPTFGARQPPAGA